MRKIFLALFMLLGTLALNGQTNSYTVDGKTYSGIPSQTVWYENIAVMNSDGGSYQVYFKNIPTKSGSYKVAEHLTFTGSGRDNEASVVVLNEDYTVQYWSVAKGGKIKVKVKNGTVTINVTKVTCCVYGTDDCHKVSGTTVLRP